MVLPNIERRAIQKTALSVCIGLFLLLGSVPAPAAETATAPALLSLAEAIRAGVRNNPDYQAVRTTETARRFQIDEATAGYLPLLEANAGIGRERSTALSLRLQDQANRNLLRQEAGLAAQQVLFDGFATPARRAAAQARQRQASADITAQREQLALEIATLYLQAAMNQNLRTVAKEYTHEHETILSLLEQRYTAGIARLSEVTLARVRVARFRAIVAELEDAERETRIQLEHVLLIPAEALDLTLPMTLMTQQQAIPARTWNSIRTSNPAIRAAMAAVQAAEQDLRQERAARFPLLTLNGEVNYRDNAAGVPTYEVDQRLMLRTEWLLYNGGAREARIGSSAATLARARIDLRAVEEAAHQTVATAENRIASTAEILSYVATGLTDARETARIYREQYLAAERSLLDVLDLTAEIFILERQQMSARYDQTLSRLLLLALGNALVAYLETASAQPSGL